MLLELGAQKKLGAGGGEALPNVISLFSLALS